jgi:hypothetical protein
VLFDGLDMIDVRKELPDSPFYPAMKRDRGEFASLTGSHSGFVR